MTDYTVRHYCSQKSKNKNDKYRFSLNEIDMLRKTCDCMTNNIN